MHNTKDIMFWLTRLGDLLYKFQQDPSEANKLYLTHTMHEYRGAVDHGLRPINIPLGEPWRRARNFSEWFSLQLDVAMSQFKSRPSDDRYEALDKLLTEYRDAVFIGKVKT